MEDESDEFEISAVVEGESNNGLHLCHVSCN